ncbi:hypothetical protein NLA06_11855 [Desulfomicrobium sp. ZS1]|uniref:hypothetical protein n=1 Tax=Desulfomicrobium sp. ZS1 TaxID=2952228 RepID=UPI0020B310AF|nr:hypothetical protein [Desulfomicrobium sp. ZS1]UTF49256.1 hypothetical protein NLA06_11855 [Desulfomicrobium sp. ZS1]
MEPASYSTSVFPQPGQVSLDPYPHGQEGDERNQQQQDEELEADAHRTSGMTA